MHTSITKQPYQANWGLDNVLVFLDISQTQRDDVKTCKNAKKKRGTEYKGDLPRHCVRLLINEIIILSRMVIGMAFFQEVGDPFAQGPFLLSFGLGLYAVYFAVGQGVPGTAEAEFREGELDR